MDASAGSKSDHAQGKSSAGDSVSAIEICGLVKSFKGHLGIGRTEAVHKLDLDLRQGEIFGFLGPNGAGKTTTMRILTGFMPPSEGTAAIAGSDVFRESIEARRATGYLPETPPLYPEMGVERYLRFVAALNDVPRSARSRAVDRALERCGLTAVRRRIIGELSKGYRQRVGLAQAIVHDPEVLILDEPTVGLDPLQLREIRSLITELAAGEAGQRHAVVLSTHILNEVEAICDRVILIDRGRVALDRPLAELTAEGRALEEVFARLTSRDDTDPVEGAP